VIEKVNSNSRGWSLIGLITYEVILNNCHHCDPGRSHYDLTVVIRREYPLGSSAENLNQRVSSINNTRPSLFAFVEL
jgi:hypothetical protein